MRDVGNFKGKLELLNRGQRWVVRKIDEQIGTISDAWLQAFLRMMADGHDVNIGALDKALADGKL